MGKTLTVELPDEIFDAVMKMAEATGRTPADWVVTDLRQRFPNRAPASAPLPKLPKELYEVLRQKATLLGRPTEDVVREWWAEHGPQPRPQLTEDELKGARERFRRHIGAASLGHPTGADNESIDADLAREYGNTHEEPA